MNEISTSKSIGELVLTSHDVLIGYKDSIKGRQYLLYR